MNVRTVARITAIALLVALVIGEAAVRLTGMVTFPTYAVDDQIGYIPKPDQHGCFLNRRCWVFNERSMGTASPWNPQLHPNILLIGNSIVMGGVPYDQPKKLGPLLQKQLGSGYLVWPVAAGGWSNVNETAYLNIHPEVLQQTKFFVWEFMVGGLSQLSTWRGEYVFPTHRPVWGLWYVLRRYVLGRAFNLDPGELPPPPAAISVANLERFDATLAQMSRATGRQEPGILLLYPDAKQLKQAREGQEWLPERSLIQQLSQKYGLRIVDVTTYPAWTESLYREGVHPTAVGNIVLAQILGSAIQDSLQREPLQ